MENTVKSIKARITAEAKAAVSLNKEIAITALLVMERARDHGDCSLVAFQMNKMPASYRRTMLAAWYSKYAPIVIEGGKDKKPFVARLSAKAKETKDMEKRAAMFDVKAAKANPWFKLAEETEEQPKEYTLAELIKMVQGIGKRIRDKDAKGTIAANDKDSALALATQLEAFTFEVKAA